MSELSLNVSLTFPHYVSTDRLSRKAFHLSSLCQYRQKMRWRFPRVVIMSVLTVSEWLKELHVSSLCTERPSGEDFFYISSLWSYQQTVKWRIAVLTDCHVMNPLVLIMSVLTESHVHVYCSTWRDLNVSVLTDSRVKSSTCLHYVSTSRSEELHMSSLCQYLQSRCTWPRYACTDWHFCKEFHFNIVALMSCCSNQIVILGCYNVELVCLQLSQRTRPTRAWYQKVWTFTVSKRKRKPPILPM